MSSKSFAARGPRGRAVLAVALGCVALGPVAAYADDTAEEIRLLKAQLRKLEAKVDAQAREERRQASAVKTQAAKAQAAKAQAASTGGSGAGMPTVAIAPLTGAPAYGVAARRAAVTGMPTNGSPSLFINGVSITPGGFLAMEGVYRSRFVGADIATPFQNIPYGNVRTGQTDEFRFSARQSRASLLVKGDVDPQTHLSGYAEMDFLGAAQTANSNESNSFNPRLRHLYAAADWDSVGLHLLAGQTWSLATADAKGIMPRQEILPLGIEAQYVPGFVWTRTPQVRLVGELGGGFWAGVSAESPATTFGGYTTVGTEADTLPSTLVYNAAPPGGSLFNSANAISLNHIPDILGKVAYDASLAGHDVHLEAFGVYRDFYSQVNNYNYNVSGGGGGGSIAVAIVPKMLEAQFSGMTGRGIGRYGAGQLPDVTFNWNGTLAPISETMLLAGVTYHPLPGLDLYAYAGQETQNATYSTTYNADGSANPFGLGNPLFVNSGCWTPGSTACSGMVRRLRQITGGFWQKIYQGDFGQLRVGMQYSFTQKTGFNAVGGAANASENILLGSLRYYPF
ncbi:hypothetical protein [Methylocella sp.]|uniref:hypothetical protein n=1 Tax=Methylocella sp. TaxID=1978226 RepID=UPI0035B47F66